MNVHIRSRKRGDIPTIRVGRLLRVPLRAMERLLESGRIAGRIVEGRRCGMTPRHDAALALWGA